MHQRMRSSSPRTASSLNTGRYIIQYKDYFNIEEIKMPYDCSIWMIVCKSYKGSKKFIGKCPSSDVKAVYILKISM